MMKPILTLLALALPLFLAASPAMADSLGQDEAREAVRKGEIRSLAEAITLVEKTYGGRVLDAELERKHGRYVYEIKQISEDGWRRKLYLDAKSLEVVKESVKRDHDKEDR